ncbi:CHASE4 domain protein [Pseudodesulfovibrio profundus]|uniref:histidine kinase n=1 Tax=Pseudodesulfovibrio profundus TaxID=57320 RepID=A0A2C8FC99_9BACT|nr:ATP-binding protein [Pseudodesulfovibrio profundus]SOB59531.1 CHASE4 domain protein [Pseudodesulfovibrio profundus]
MKLRNILFASLGILAVIVLSVGYAITNRLVSGAFLQLEKEEITSHVVRAKNELHNQLHRLDLFLWDWSSWDDTFDFAMDGNEDYRTSNLMPLTFQEQHLAAMIINNGDGKTVFGKAYNEDGSENQPLNQFLRDIMAQPETLPAISDEGGRGGFVIVGGKPYVFSVRQIFTSAGRGTDIGHFLMARHISPALVETIAEDLVLDMTVFTEAQSPIDWDESSDILPHSTPDPTIIPESEDTIKGFITIGDIYNKPALVIQVSSDRRIMNLGKSVSQLSAISMAVVILVAGILIFIILQRRVLSRLERLNSQVQRIRISGHTDRVNISGSDELAQLAYSVNMMLERLESDQRKLSEARDELEDKVADRTKELEKANKELRTLDIAKNHFLSATSHELRTPLTAIHGFVKLMERDFKKHFSPHLKQQEDLTTKVSKHLTNFTVVHNETKRLGTLIGDMLDLNKIEAGKIIWRDANVAPGQIVNRAAKSIAGLIESNGAVELLVDIEPQLPHVHVDKDRLHQVLINLLNNAVKFTEDGYIKISASKVPDGVQFSVSDTGKGISSNDVPRLFELFYQADRGDRETPSLGTGIGLAICKEIVEHYGGTISVESEIGKGSSFFFTIPSA